MPCLQSLVNGYYATGSHVRTIYKAMLSLKVAGITRLDTGPLLHQRTNVMGTEVSE